MHGRTALIKIMNGNAPSAVHSEESKRRNFLSESEIYVYVCVCVCVERERLAANWYFFDCFRVLKLSRPHSSAFLLPFLLTRQQYFHKGALCCVLLRPWLMPYTPPLGIAHVNEETPPSYFAMTSE